MKHSNFKKALKAGVSNLGIEIHDSQLDQFIHHYELILKFGKIVNLTGLDKPADVANRLFVDSLIAYKYISESQSGNILEIGSGAGFPSIPLRILLNQEFRFTLIEKRERVSYFLEELVSTLKLPNIKVIHSRLEDQLDNPDMKSKFDCVLNKATFQIQDYLPAVQPFIAPKGLALHWTNEKPEKSLSPEWEFIDLISSKLESRSKVAVYRFRES